jgi:phosphatidylinositol-3-phosphatase
VVIVMENKEASSVLSNPSSRYLDSLARRYALATRSYAITHPSLPNYIALTSGGTHGITSDCSSCTVSAPNLASQLDAAGISWAAYLEGVPGPCYRGAAAGGYVAKHNPFIHYRDVLASRSLCHRLVGFGALARALRTGTLPTFAWITPNLCDDTHDCPVATGDRFLARTVPALLAELGPQGFLVITWDEGTSDSPCCGGAAAGGRIATVLAGPLVVPGARLLAPIDHYGVLATIEQALGLSELGAAGDARNGSLQALFSRSAHVR